MAENYIVSARKYRPQTFDTVVGQQHITTTLKNAIRHQQLAHAYLFCGPRGVGKTTCARILARTINCENPTPDMEACGECNTCLSFKNNTSFNVFELDAASNNSVDDIRNLIDQVRFAPQQGKYKIYIIDEVHMLSAAAFNAFLKTLEEPPPYAIFILATTEKHKILPTILSRCQIFDFKRITTNDIVDHLQSIASKEHLNAEEAGLHVIAQKSEGCMRDALSMLDRISSFTNGVLSYAATMEHLNLLDADYYFRLTDHMLAQDVAGTLLLLDQVLEKGFEGDVIIGGLAEHLRNLLLCKDQRMAKLLDVPNDHKPIYFEKANQTPPAFILSALNVINEAELGYKNATNKRLHIELCLIRLCYVLHATQNSDAVKKNSSNVVPPPAPMPQAQIPQTQTPQPPARPVMQEPVMNQQPAPQQTSVTPANGQNLQEPGAQYHRAAAPPPPQPVPQSFGPQNMMPSSKATTTSSNANEGAGRRIRKNLLENIDASLSNAGADTTTAETKELTLEWATELYNQYKQKAREESKSVLFAQLSMMQLEVHPPEEVRIIAPSEITEMYALDQRNDLIEYYRAHTGIRVRVTTEIREDVTIVHEQKAILSKPEIYEAMVRKNPNLGKLKDALNLQIEY
ncbi:DNA polymerase III subunit gamma/tau [Taibaiella soli]|uniref:DNA polymerase III subunit gamma/tau n=1 Tax=Taibaiella soli TaxID=1649169 RepID=A0A2W2AJJ1_9BACT|nr:DNA polymerase III subunit gamma/tau [Taibaiella soli]PZF73682.1 DNA polymerase III subunit gamma/tau [Taibaiella soli]